MQHYLLLLLLFVTVLSEPVAAQKSSTLLKARVFPRVTIPAPGNFNRPLAEGCDTINYPVPISWSSVIYISPMMTGEDGFVTGNNAYFDRQKAAYFDVSATDNIYLTRVWIAFVVANGDLTKIVPIRIYDGTTGSPGSLLATVNTTLGDIRNDALAANYHDIVFNPAVELPASKKFFVSVDINNLIWNYELPEDSLAILSNADGESLNNSWEQFADGTWHSFSSEEAWGIDLSMYIHPFVSTNTSCAVTIPVTLGEFKGRSNGNSNILTWSTYMELNNTGFEIQRSIDGVTFTPIGFAPSKAMDGFSNGLLKYQFTDHTPAPGNNFYRLNQKDKNGRSSLSNVLNLKNNGGTEGINSLYPNPAGVKLFAGVSVAHRQSFTMEISDLSGRVLARKVSSVAAGNNMLSINTGQLSEGIYQLKVVLEDGITSYLKKFIKH